LSIDIEGVKAEQARQAERHRTFMTGMKDRMLQLVSVLTRQKSDRQAAAKRSGRAAPAQTVPAAKSRGAPLLMSMVPASGANDAPRAVQNPDSVYDEDVVVSPALVRDALEQAIAANRIDIYMQPIATLPARRVHAYEVYGRVRLSPGVYIPAREYRGVAAHTGALVKIDRMVLNEIARQSVPPVPIFVNITRDALSDRATVIAVVQMIRNNPTLAHRLVLEITHKDFQRLGATEEPIMRELQRIGVEFGINDVQGPDIDLNRMASLSFRYLKLPQDRLLTSPTGMESAPVIQRFLTRLQTRNIQLIVSQIETDRTVRQLLDYPVALGQGYVFGRPDRPVAYTKKAQGA
jgi:cyclic-di-GMP phosphodiesterase TipF (flagellum assembly factor)